MDTWWDYVLLLLGQFAGGPGPKENNLIRFGLATVLWTVLLAVAWSRQRGQPLPRERLLVWGFGLSLARELYMFSHVSAQLLGVEILGTTHISEPLEHGLTMAAVVMVAGAFIRYILDAPRLARRYLQAGLAVAAISFLAIWRWWHLYASTQAGSRFNRTWGGVIFHLFTALFAALAILIIWRQRGWLRNAIALALGLFVVIGLLRLANFWTAHAYSDVLCPVCNSLHILAIPIFGYVYIREQSIEKLEAQNALTAYRDRLQDLVAERTAELTDANTQLQQEIADRQQAEESIAQRNAELAAQNAIAATLSRSLDLDRLLDTTLDTVLGVLEMDAGCIHLLDPSGKTLTLHTSRQRGPATLTPDDGSGHCSCMGIARRAIAETGPAVIHVDPDCASGFVREQGFRTLVSTPLISKDRPVGALGLGSRRRESIRPHELDILAAIGQQIGMAVENARLYQQTGEWAEELALLHESSIFLTGSLDPDTIYMQLTEQTVKLLGCQAGAILLWDSRSAAAVPVFTHRLDRGLDRLELVDDESGLLCELVTHRRSIAVEDARGDARVPATWHAWLGSRAFLAVPLWGKAQPLAFLILIDQHPMRQWRPNEVIWVESFANPAAIALENAYLYEQVERAAILEERQRIAADMHDGLAQTLSYVTLKAYHATELLGEGDTSGVLAEHRDIQQAIEQATRDVRHSIASLQQSPRPPQSIQAILAAAVEEFRGDGPPPVEFADSINSPLYLPPEQAEQFVRMVQEAMLNARRHARASRINVRVETRNGILAVTVADDGRGFDPDGPPPGGDHFGLSIMRARAARIGGQLHIDSAPGRGTRIIVTVQAESRRA